MAKFIKTFLSDEDGFSARDFMMVVFTIAYIAIVILAAYNYMFIGGDINPLLSILNSMDGIMITIVGGIFGVTAVEKYRAKPNNNDSKPPI